MIDSGQSIDRLINQHSAALVAFYDSKRRKKPDIMFRVMAIVIASGSSVQVEPASSFKYSNHAQNAHKYKVK